MNKTVLFVLVALGSLLSFAFADELTKGVTIEGSNYLRYDEGREVDIRRQQDAFGNVLNYPDNTTPRHFFENRLRLDIYRGNLRVGGRFLYFSPSSQDIFKDGLIPENRIDKRYLEATLKPVKIRLGNFSDVWGHGLAFSSFENREIYFDTELDGAHVELDAEPLYVTAIRGSSAEGRAVHKADITGIRVNPRFGVQSLAFNYIFVDSAAYPETHVASVDGHLVYGPVTVYGEHAWNRTFFSLKTEAGHATYLAGVLSQWGYSLLLEYKDYDYKVVTPFQNPPTVYRELGPRLLQGRDPHVLNIPDEVGYQVELTGQVTPTTFATVHYNLSSSHKADQKGIPLPTLKQINSPYWESFASVEQDLPASRKLMVEVGANEESAVVWQKRMWAMARFSTPIYGSNELEFETETVQITDKTRNDLKITDQLLSLGWDNGHGISLAIGQELSTDKDLKNREGNGWPSVEGAMVFGGGKHRAAIFYGRERGGLRCSNGVCRQVQAFSGLRFTLETSL